MAGPEKKLAGRDARLRRLAAGIDALADKDATALRRARETMLLRRAAAAEIYGICGSFVEHLNRLLSRGEIILDPPDYADQDFQESAANLIQMNVRGRILQVEFELTGELISTEDFRMPYTLQGTVRAFNQELLEKDLIEEQLIFYTLEKPRPMWRFFDVRTHRSGPFDEDYLATLLDRLL